MKRRDIEPAKTRPAKPIDWRSGYTWLAVAVLVVVGLNLYPAPVVGIFVGLIFTLLGIRILFSLFGPYETRRPWVIPAQAFGRVALGLLMIFLGGLGAVSGTSDLRPSLVYEYPRFGDLRTLFWDKERFAELACEAAENGPPEELRFAVERAPPGAISCPGFGSARQSILATAEGDEEIDTIITARRFVQNDLDRKLIALSAWDRRLAIESLVVAGANPNALVDDRSALRTALESKQTSLAVWLLEHGAQASLTFADGSTLLDVANGVDQIDKRQPYVELLLRHGAAEAPQVELNVPSGRRPR